MVEVHFYVSRRDIDDETFDAEAVGCHHRKADAFVDVFLVKLTVNLKNLAVELYHFLGVVAAERLVGHGHDIVCVAGGKPFESGFERLDHAFGHAEHDALWSLVGDFVDQ